MNSEAGTGSADQLLKRTRQEPISDELAAQAIASCSESTREQRRVGINALRVIAERDPRPLVDSLSSVESIVHEATADEDPNVRAAAAVVLGTGVEIGEFDSPVAARSLQELLDDSRLVRHRALLGLRHCANRDPEAVTGSLDLVANELTADPKSQAEAGRIFARVATEEPAAILPHVADLVTVFTGTGTESVDHRRVKEARNATQDRLREYRAETQDQQRTARVASGHALVELGLHRPERLLDDLPSIGGSLDDPAPHIRMAAADILVAVGAADPAEVVPFAESLAALIREDEAPFVRARGIQALASATAADEAAIRNVLPKRTELIADALEHDEAAVRGAAATLLAVAATERPGVIDPVRDQLETLAADDRQFVSAPARDALDAGR